MTLQQRQTFDTLKELKLACLNYALSTTPPTNIAITQSTGDYIVYHCTGKVPVSAKFGRCSFRISARRRGTQDEFEIYRMETEHTCEGERDDGSVIRSMKTKLARVERTAGAPRAGTRRKKRKVGVTHADSDSETDWVAQVNDEGDYVDSEEEDESQQRYREGKEKLMGSSKELKVVASPASKRNGTVKSSSLPSSSSYPKSPYSISNSKLLPLITTGPSSAPRPVDSSNLHLRTTGEPAKKRSRLPPFSPPPLRNSMKLSLRTSRCETMPHPHPHPRPPITPVLPAFFPVLPTPSLSPITTSLSPDPFSIISPPASIRNTSKFAPSSAQFHPTLLRFLTHLSPALASHCELFLLSGLTSTNRITSLLVMKGEELLAFVEFLRVGTVLEADQGETRIIKGLPPFFLSGVFMKGIERVRKDLELELEELEGRC
ncbi:hypothetical protein P7C70_g7763, partial [Phenoliferia sp. Uapishka_3]